MSDIKVRKPNAAIKRSTSVVPDLSLSQQLKGPEITREKEKLAKGTEVARIVRIDSMLDMALDILDDQIVKFKLAFKVATVDDKEVKILESLLSTVTKVSREQRERDKADDFSDMSDEELLTLFTELMEKRGLKK